MTAEPVTKPALLTSLSAAQADEILALADAAQAADGVGPLSEPVLLHVRHGGDTASGNADDPGRDAVVTADDGSLAGYAYLGPPDEAADGDMSGELVVHPAHRRQGHGRALLQAALGGAPDRIAGLAIGRASGSGGPGDVPRASTAGGSFPRASSSARPIRWPSLPSGAHRGAPGGRPPRASTSQLG